MKVADAADEVGQGCAREGHLGAVVAEAAEAKGRLEPRIKRGTALAQERRQVRSSHRSSHRPGRLGCVRDALVGHVERARQGARHLPDEQVRAAGRRVRVQVGPVGQHKQLRVCALAS